MTTSNVRSVAGGGTGDGAIMLAQQMAAARKALDRSFVQLLTATVVTHSDGAEDLEAARAVAARLAALLDKFA